MTIYFNANYVPSTGVGHLEIRCDRALPITETGYKSIFVNSADINDIKVAAALIRQTLDQLADQTGWQPEVHMELF